MSTRTLVFTTFLKFDGNNQRYCWTEGEYSQICERAGRRNKDDFGNIIIMINKNIEKEKLLKIIKGKPSPLISNFKPSINVIANLMQMEGLKFDQILSKSFYQFRKKKI